MPMEPYVSPLTRVAKSRPALHLSLAAALAVPLAVAIPAFSGTSARAADEVAGRPASGAFTVSGRGFGHGRGMSQWGAYGAADAGLGWEQILDFYYPGTVRSAMGDPEIRVWISADTDGDTQVLPAAGLSAAVGATTRVLPTGAEYAAWRAVASGGKVSLQYRGTSGGWKGYPLASGPSIRFTTGSGVVRVVLPGGSSKDLRGSVSAVADGSATRSLRTVLNSTMQSYLRSVVPNEMPSSWHREAVAAQSVAARTYASSYRDRQRSRGATWDICDTITCQVFKGVATYTSSGRRTATEDARATAAIEATAGVVMRTSAAAGAPFVHAEFSASNGGYTAAGGPVYQVAKPDPYDGRKANPNTNWTKAVTPAAVEKAFSVGSLRAVTVTGRDGNGPLGGRVTSMRIEGSRGTVTATGAKFRAALGLKSDWFTVAGATPPAPAPTPAPAPAPDPAPSPNRPPASTTPGAAGHSDLVYTDAAGNLWRRPALAGGYGAATRIGTHWNTLDSLLAPGQWDGSGGVDLIARQKKTGRLVLYRGDTKGGLRGPGFISGDVRHLTSIMSAGDVDGDGYRDLVAIDSRTNAVVLLRGGRGGTIAGTKQVSKPAGIVALRGAGELTGDGKVDIVWSDRSGRVHVGVGDGAGGISRVISHGRGWNSFVDVWSPGDLNSDGINDLLALRPNGVVARYDGNWRGGFANAKELLRGLRVVLVAR